MRKADFILKRYSVQVNGFPDVVYDARSPGQARSKAWHDYHLVDDRCTFKRFMKISRVLRDPITPAHYGAEIWVADERAFYVGWNGQYVRFVRPGSDLILNSHPLDVMRPWMQGGGNGSIPF